MTTQTLCSSPIVDNITVSDWEWMTLADILQLRSTDCSCSWRNKTCKLETCIANDQELLNKRNDPGYQRLLDSIQDLGFLDPIFIEDEVAVANGHHRLLAAIDLGYDRVPVTHNRDHYMRTSGGSTTR